MFMDNTFEDSFTFSSLVDQIIISIGFDKSDSDFVGTWRPCNRKNGNSALFVQTFACLEGPVTEDYANELVTIGNPEFPIKATVQELVDDSLYTLVASDIDAKDGRVRKCACFVFVLFPGRGPGTHWPLTVQVLPVSVNETTAFRVNDDVEGSPDYLPDDDSGLPPKIHLPISSNHFSICFVVSDEDPSIVVGFQVLVENVIVTTKRLYDRFEPHCVRSLVVKCYQLSGQLSNDGKQINILTGQGSCSGVHPMPGCMVQNDHFGKPPMWIHYAGEDCVEDGYYREQEGSTEGCNQGGR